MIITQFKGRIGNQLFEYAAARKFALDGNTELKIDLRNYSADLNTYSMRFFNIIENVATKEECDRLQNKDFLYYTEKLLPYYKRRFVWEKDFMFDQNLVGIKRKNMYIRGQFQSQKYFEGIEDIIRKEFTLKEPLENKYKEFISHINKTNSISIHIRRGDIMSVNIDKPVMTISYYKKAVEYIKTRVDNPHFFVFSDDIDWARENLNFIQSINFVSGKDTADYEELILMSKCKHNIIANSTFSWWGAWLNNNSEKIVVCPKIWFTGHVKNKKYTDNLLLKSWIKLDNTDYNEK